ncbi:MAG: NosD domain-containing protein, partial [Candidatus Aenigmatarchaeota archaeon]
IGLNDSNNTFNNFLRNNISYNDAEFAVWIDESNNCSFINNTFMEFDGDAPLFINNQTEAINLSNNYWGTTNTTTINNSIYDGKNVSAWGNATFTPFLTEAYTPSASALSCGDTITSNTTLTENLTSNGSCFTIGANDITLDCAGYSITGNQSGSAINITSYNSTVVKNCVITNFTRAIVADTANYLNITNNSLYNNSGDPSVYTLEFVQNVNHSSITYNRIYNNSVHGIFLNSASTNNTIMYNNISENSAGSVFIIFSSNNTVVSNTMASNTYGAIFLSAYNNTISSNTIANNTQGVVLVIQSTYNNFTDNIIANNTAYGISMTNNVAISDVSNNTFNNFFRNNITDNGVGIYSFQNNTNNTYINNTIANNTNQSFYNNDTFAVNVSSNYWGSTNCTIINASIYDGKNDSGLGNVTFLDFLNASYPDGSLRNCTEPATPALACGDTITSSTNMTENLTSAGTCFTIGANDIVLDCAGYKISGDTTDNGITLGSYNNVTIKNCVVTGFSIGMDVNGVTNITVLNNTVYNNSYGIGSSGSPVNINITGNRFYNNTIHAILLPGGSGHSFTNNFIYNNTQGGIVLMSQPNNITNNNLTSNQYGLVLIMSDNNTITGNIINNNSDFGFGVMITSDYNNITDNIVANNTNYGLILTNNVVVSNTSNSTFNNLFRNNITDNGVGIYVYQNCTNNSFVNNTISGSTTYSFHNNQSFAVNASNNYWGTTSCGAINLSIYDGKNDSNLGNVTYSPYLDAAYPSGSFLACAAAIGNASNISTNVANINITVAGSTTVPGNITGVQNVSLFNSTKSYLNFSWNFTKAALNISAINVTVQNSSATVGVTIIRGINLSSHGQTKTVYVDRISGEDQICVKDADITSITEVSSACTGTNEFIVSCPGSNGAYACTVSGTQYIVTGLNNSGIVEFPVTAAVTSVSGGGGGSTGCTQNWSCSSWSSCYSNSTQSRNCADLGSCNLENKTEWQNCTYVEATTSTLPTIPTTPNVSDEGVSSDVDVTEVNDTGVESTLEYIFADLNIDSTTAIGILLVVVLVVSIASVAAVHRKPKKRTPRKRRKVTEKKRFKKR